jgi:hypothetical protein
MPYFDDDGNEINPAEIPLPRMCGLCDKKDDPYEEILCNLNRLDQRDEAEFKCGAFVSLYGPLIDAIIE